VIPPPEALQQETEVPDMPIPKTPGFIVQLHDGTLLLDDYSTVIMFASREDALVAMQDAYQQFDTIPDGVRVRPLVRWRKPRRRPARPAPGDAS